MKLLQGIVTVAAAHDVDAIRRHHGDPVEDANRLLARQPTAIGKTNHDGGARGIQSVFPAERRRQ